MFTVIVDGAKEYQGHKNLEILEHGEVFIDDNSVDEISEVVRINGSVPELRIDFPGVLTITASHSSYTDFVLKY